MGRSGLCVAIRTRGNRSYGPAPPARASASARGPPLHPPSPRPRASLASASRRVGARRPRAYVHCAPVGKKKNNGGNGLARVAPTTHRYHRAALATSIPGFAVAGRRARPARRQVGCERMLALQRIASSLNDQGGLSTRQGGIDRQLCIAQYTIASQFLPGDSPSPPAHLKSKPNGFAIRPSTHTTTVAPTLVSLARRK